MTTTGDRANREGDAPTIREWLLLGLLAVNLWWTTLCLGGYRPETMVLGSSLTGALLFIHLLAGTVGANPQRTHRAGLFFIPFLAYAAANVMKVTPVAWLGWQDWLLWAQTIAVFWVVLNGFCSRRVQDLALDALVGVAAVGAVLACYQRFFAPDWLMLGRTQALQFIGRSSGSFGSPASMAALLILVLPLAGVRAWDRLAPPARRAIFALLTALLAFGLVLTISRAAWLALALALALWPLFVSEKSWAWRLGRSAFAAGLFFAVVATLYETAPKVHARIDAFIQEGGERTRPIMWRAAWKIFNEHRWLGGGAGGYNILIEKFRPENFQDEPQWAHNEYLNTLSDYGMAGFVLFFGAAGAVAWRCLRRHSRMQAGDAALAIGALAFLLQMSVDFLLKIPALGMAFAAVAGILVRRCWPPSASLGEHGAGTRALFGFSSAGAIAGILAFVLPHYRSEAARYPVRREIDRLATKPMSSEAERELLERARKAFLSATEIDPANAQAWADRAYADALLSRFTPGESVQLGLEAEAFARRAVELSGVVPEFWVRLGVALDLQGKWPDGGEAINQALKLAPNNGSIWFYQAYHFSLKPAFRLIAEAQVATSLRLDPGNREAEALRQRLTSPK